MPAPKRANWEPGAEARRTKAQRRRFDQYADEMRAAGWTVVPPEGVGPTEPKDE